MPIEIPETVKQFLSEKAYGHVVTRNPDGSPQVSMVWMDVDGNDVLFNTAEGRVKPRNLRNDPRIIISVQSPAEKLDKLAKRLLDMDEYPFRAPDEKRLLVRMQVDRIGGFGI